MKTKKIWVSRDKEDCFNEVDIWDAKPEKNYGEYVGPEKCLGRMNLNASKKLFGSAALGMCKCFEIKEVEE